MMNVDDVQKCVHTISLITTEKTVLMDYCTVWSRYNQLHSQK